MSRSEAIGAAGGTSGDQTEFAEFQNASLRLIPLLRSLGIFGSVVSINISLL